MTDSFGTRLRRERERRQIALADIATRTKVRASLFAAIERDDASQWPSGIFRRAFIRGYADAVGLDPDAVVREFVELFPDPSAEAHPPSAPPLPMRSESAVSPPASSLPRKGDVEDEGARQFLRLTLEDTGLPFRSGRVLSDVKQRWSAAAWDLGSLVAIAVTVYMVLDAFWIPIGVTALGYYIGGILLLGNSPGVCLFAPRASDSAPPAPATTRSQRQRAVDVAGRATPQPGARAHRFRVDRHRHANG